jgi:hypothetical protein
VSVPWGVVVLRAVQVHVVDDRAVVPPPGSASWPAGAFAEGVLFGGFAGGEDVNRRHALFLGLCVAKPTAGGNAVGFGPGVGESRDG